VTLGATAAVDPAWLDELSEFLAIPSISASPAHRDDVGRAVGWVADFVERLGGTATVQDGSAGLPLLVGEVPAARRPHGTTPTVMLYGHCDVQPVEPLDAWDSDPFSATVRDGWLYARGAADDKGNFYLLLKALENLVRSGDLPVDVRVVCDGEEEVIGTSVVDFLTEDERGADACIIFDGPMPQRDVPAFKLGQRGLVFFHVTVQTGEHELHSGMYGGAALNAASVMSTILAAAVAGAGTLQDGVRPPTQPELEEWARLGSGADALQRKGARPLDECAADDFYPRVFATAAVDVHGISCGEAALQKTVIPVEAEANVSVRVAAGQDPEELAEQLAGLLTGAAPEGTEVTLKQLAGSPGTVVPADTDAVRLARAAFEHTLGTRPVLMRSGGTLPVVAALVDNGIPAVVTGFDVPEGNVHAPNERLLMKYLPLGIASAQETLLRFAELRSATTDRKRGT